MNQEEKILLIGRVGMKPELRYTPKQEAVCNFSVAEKLEGTEEPRWHRVVVWGRQAEICSVQVNKGSEVFVHGRKVIRHYKDKDGNAKTVQEVSARLVGLSSME